MAALLVTRAGFPGAASTRHRELRGLHPKGKARPDSRHRKLLQLWLADEAEFGGGEQVEFHRRDRRRAAAPRGRQRSEHIAEPAAAGQRFESEIFVNETGGKGVAGAAGINHMDF